MSRLSSFTGRVASAKAELLAALTGVLGWSLVTWAIAGVGAPHLVWRLSAGLFFLTLFGFNFLREIGRKGIYALMKAKR